MSRTTIASRPGARVQLTGWRKSDQRAAFQCLFVAFDVIRYIVIRSFASFDHPRNGVDRELSSTMSI
jgi:hypothetical protein